MNHFPTSNPHLTTTTIILLFLFLSSPSTCSRIRYFPTTPNPLSGYTESPNYLNGVNCSLSTIHVAMTIDLEYLRGSIAAVHSTLRHASCPENIHFHFIAAEFDPASPRDLTRLVRSIFPSLTFKLYIFREDTVINLISSSIRVALENPLNYARNYLGELLDPGVTRVIYLDSDVLLVDDVATLWNINLKRNRVIGAPEYCHTNFTNYFTDRFWSDPLMSGVFRSGSVSGSGSGLGSGNEDGKGRRRACYFNTGVMVMDMVKWRSGGYRKRIEKWMEVQRVKRIYELGSLPPFLLVFGGRIEPVEHRWNQHGLGGDNVKGSCRGLHAGAVSLLHWSGKGKPWVRLDEGRACLLDRLWEPYDLYRRGSRGREVGGLGVMGGGFGFD